MHAYVLKRRAATVKVLSGGAPAKPKVKVDLKSKEPKFISPGPQSQKPDVSLEATRPARYPRAPPAAAPDPHETHPRSGSLAGPVLPPRAPQGAPPQVQLSV